MAAASRAQSASRATHLVWAYLYIPAGEGGGGGLKEEGGGGSDAAAAAVRLLNTSAASAPQRLCVKCDGN